MNRPRRIVILSCTCIAAAVCGATALLAFMLLTTCGFARGVTGLTELGFLFVILPLVLLCGAGGSIPAGRFSGFCKFMGRYSFPLYATHYPFTTLLKGWLVDHPELPASTHAAFIVALLTAIFATAYLAMCGSDRVANLLSRK